jgi:molybdate transport system substrate-binding protein
MPAVMRGAHSLRIFVDGMSARWRAFAAAVGLALLAVPPATAAAPGREILVFAAASLTDALQEIGAAFERETGVRVVCSFAGSNDLARQIRAGAPADVFVSANAERMDELVVAGLVRPADRFDLLSNALVVVVSAGSSLSVRGPADLVHARALALGDPEAVPAGIYARRWLERVGWWERLRGRVVPTLDVRAALAAVDSGAAEAGIVYRTDAAMARRARVAFEVPASEGPRIVYPAAVLVAAPPDARRFLEDLRSPASRAVFERLGFEVLGER